MPLRHAALALMVVAIWGSNFVVIKFALASLPPLLLAALRFSLAFLPAALVVRRPSVPLRALAAYGLLIGLGQFGLLFIAMDGLISPGLASVVVQMQVFFTIGLAVLLRGERVRGFQLVALAMGLGGIGTIVAYSDTASATGVGVLLVLGAGLSWSLGNMVSTASGGARILPFVVWSSAFAVPPLFVLSLLLEGWPAVVAGVQGAEWSAWAAVFWQSLGNTLLGYGIWAWLLQRHPAAVVAPWALMVPVFGLLASALLLGEAMPAWKLAAAGLIVSGLGVGSVWPAWLRMRQARAGAPG
jgi:O-acetylserine/cysteine efflux transporter